MLEPDASQVYSLSGVTLLHRASVACEKGQTALGACHRVTARMLENNVHKALCMVLNRDLTEEVPRCLMSLALHYHKTTMRRDKLKHGCCALASSHPLKCCVSPEGTGGVLTTKPMMTQSLEATHSRLEGRGTAYVSKIQLLLEGAGCCHPKMCFFGMGNILG